MRRSRSVHSVRGARCGSSRGAGWRSLPNGGRRARSWWLLLLAALVGIPGCTAGMIDSGDEQAASTSNELIPLNPVPPAQHQAQPNAVNPFGSPQPLHKPAELASRQQPEPSFAAQPDSQFTSAAPIATEPEAIAHDGASREFDEENTIPRMELASATRETEIPSMDDSTESDFKLEEDEKDKDKDDRRRRDRSRLRRSQGGSGFGPTAHAGGMGGAPLRDPMNGLTGRGNRRGLAGVRAARGGADGGAENFRETGEFGDIATFAEGNPPHTDALDSVLQDFINEYASPEQNPGGHGGEQVAVSGQTGYDDYKFEGDKYEYEGAEHGAEPIQPGQDAGHDHQQGHDEFPGHPEHEEADDLGQPPHDHFPPADDHQDAHHPEDEHPGDDEAHAEDPGHGEDAGHGDAGHGDSGHAGDGGQSSHDGHHPGHGDGGGHGSGSGHPIHPGHPSHPGQPGGGGHGIDDVHAGFPPHGGFPAFPTHPEYPQFPEFHP
jgi:hypothetical protein